MYWVIIINRADSLIHISKIRRKKNIYSKNMHTMSIISTCSILKICSCWGKCFYSGRSFCFNRSSGVNRSFRIRQNLLHLIRQELRIRQKRQMPASLDHCKLEFCPLFGLKYQSPSRRGWMTYSTAEKSYDLLRVASFQTSVRDPREHPSQRGSA